MGKYKNAIRRLQAFMDSARGKTILNDTFKLVRQS